MSEGQKDSRQKLIDSAVELFYRDGYRTGLSDILRTAGLNKSTFYHYFESKEALVLEALTLRSESEHKFLRDLAAKKKDLGTFLSSWVQTVTRAARSGKFVGCPLAAFAYQLSEAEAKVYGGRLALTTHRWLGDVVQFIESLQKAGNLPATLDAEALGMRILTAYEGAVTMWRLTRSDKHWTHLKQEFARIANDAVET